jgi:hypothetical protein
MKAILHDYLHLIMKRKWKFVNVFKKYTQKCHANVNINQEKCPIVNVRVKNWACKWLHLHKFTWCANQPHLHAQHWFGL